LIARRGHSIAPRDELSLRFCWPRAARRLRAIRFNAARAPAPDSPQLFPQRSGIAECFARRAGSRSSRRTPLVECASFSDGPPLRSPAPALLQEAVPGSKRAASAIAIARGRGRSHARCARASSIKARTSMRRGYRTIRAAEQRRSREGGSPLSPAPPRASVEPPRLRLAAIDHHPRPSAELHFARRPR